MSVYEYEDYSDKPIVNEKAKGRSGWGLAFYDAVHHNQFKTLNFSCNQPRSRLWSIRWDALACFDDPFLSQDLVDWHGIDMNAPFAETRFKTHMDFGPIHLVALKGYTGLLNFLYERGVDLDQTTGTLNRTALHIAVLNNKVGCFNHLLKYGASPDIRDTFGNTPLSYAAEDERPAMLERLIGKQVFLDNLDITQKTPLMKAVRNNRIQAVKELVKAGASLDLRDRMKDTALHYAARKSTFEAGRILIEVGCYLNPQNQQGNTPLMEAVCYNNRDATMTLIKTGCIVNFRDLRNGNTALHIAVKRNYLEIVDQLLSSGTVEYVYNYNGELALWDVFANDRMDLFKLFLRHNYDIEKPSKLEYDGSGGKTFLATALEKENFRFLSILAEIGFVINCPKAQYALGDDERDQEMATLVAQIDAVNSSRLRGTLRTLTPQQEEQHLRNIRSFLVRIKPVRKLKQLCRVAIRRSIGFNIRSKLDQLPLPVPLKEYVLLDDTSLNLDACGKLT